MALCWVYMHDNDLKHVSCRVEDWLWGASDKILVRPTQSPNLKSYGKFMDRRRTCHFFLQHRQGDNNYGKQLKEHGAWLIPYHEDAKQ
ncbi:hypothetical protein Trydic_g17672 [Trypoxylus dichotomus]